MLVGARARLAVLVRAPLLQVALRREGAVEQQLGQPEVGLAARRDELAAEARLAPPSDTKGAANHATPAAPNHTPNKRARIPLERTTRITRARAIDEGSAVK